MRVIRLYNTRDYIRAREKPHRVKFPKITKKPKNQKFTFFVRDSESRKSRKVTRKSKKVARKSKVDGKSKSRKSGIFL